MNRLLLTALPLVLAVSAALAIDTRAQQPDAPSELRIGMIGLDTSHAPAFAKLINAEDAEGPLARMRVVAAFPQSSSDIASSRDRIEDFTQQIDAMGIEIVDSMDQLLSQVDAVLIESVDGRPHLEQVAPVFEAGLPVFIDKPLAGDLAEAMAIQMLAEKHGARWFSSSSLRFAPSIIRFREDPSWQGKVRGAFAWSPASLESTHPDLYWYGVHGVETLYTAMGEGCQHVTRTTTDGTDVVTGVWQDGRVGTFRGLRDGKRDYGLVVFGEHDVDRTGTYEGYGPLVQRIADFFAGGEPPVAASETLEMFAFMEAADESKRRGGAPVDLAEVLKTARDAAQRRVAEVERSLAERR